MTLIILIILGVLWGITVSVAEKMLGWPSWAGWVLCILGGLFLAVVLS